MSTPANTGKYDFPKIHCQSQYQYSTLCEVPIINALRRHFLLECEEFDVPEIQLLSVLHTMLLNDALKFFTVYDASTAATVDDAFSPTPNALYDSSS